MFRPSLDRLDVSEFSVQPSLAESQSTAGVARGWVPRRASLNRHLSMECLRLHGGHDRSARSDGERRGGSIAAIVGPGCVPEDPRQERRGPDKANQRLGGQCYAGVRGGSAVGGPGTRNGQSLDGTKRGQRRPGAGSELEDGFGSHRDPPLSKTKTWRTNGGGGLPLPCGVFAAAEVTPGRSAMNHADARSLHASFARRRALSAASPSHHRWAGFSRMADLTRRHFCRAIPRHCACRETGRRSLSEHRV
jgi:hypothetical protein